MANKKKKIKVSDIKIYGPNPRTLFSILAIIAGGGVVAIFGSIGVHELRGSSALSETTYQDSTGQSPVQNHAKTGLVLLLLGVTVSLLILFLIRKHTKPSK